MESIKATISAVTGTSTAPADSTSSTTSNTSSSSSTSDPNTDTSNTATHTPNANNKEIRSQKPYEPIPEETGLQSRGQTVETGGGTFRNQISQAQDSDSAVRASGEDIVGVGSSGGAGEVGGGGVGGGGEERHSDEQVADFIRDKYRSDVQDPGVVGRQ